MARPRKNAAKGQQLLPGAGVDVNAIPEIPVEEQPYPLPEGWKWVRLGDVVSTSKMKTEDFSALGLRYIGLEHMEKDKGIVGFGAATEIRSTKNIFFPGQILYGKLRPYLNKHDVVDFAGVCSTDILVFDCKEIAINKFVNMYFDIRQFKEHVVSNSKGINLPRVSEQSIFRASFPLPPLEEQQRIVANIESLFAKLDAAKEKAQAVLDGAEIRKAAILHKAFTGELTSQWREGQGVEPWKDVYFSDIIDKIEAGKNLRCEERPPQEDEVGIVKVSAVTWGSFNETESKTCYDKNLYNEYIAIKSGDFLFSRANAIQLVGNCVIVDHISKKLMLSDKILRLKINRCAVKKFVYYFTASAMYREQVKSLASGNQDGMRNISQKNLLQISLPLPSLPEQQEIVRILDELLSKEQQIQDAAETVLGKIEQMKQAVLAKAFRGELSRPLEG